MGGSMNILVINCGSSSLKYQLINTSNEEVLAKGLVERIGIEGSRIKHEAKDKEKQVIEKPLKDHKDAINLVIECLLDKEYGAIKDVSEIGAVGHRVVHGGEDFADSVLITDEVMKAIDKNVDLAPLHNPPNIIGIKACEEIMKDVPQVAVFDTAFHQTMPAENYMYAIPYEYYDKYKIRRYGFHGTSHKYVTERTAEILNIEKDKLNVIVCHLGNGSSISCVENGKCKDTSMGLTPLEGLIMGTRSGNIDPAIVTFLMEKENLSPQEMNDILNKKSGVLALSGVSSDFRDIEDGAAEGNVRCQLALNQFDSKVAKIVASYMTELDHVDAIVFTAGVGENSISNREHIAKKLEIFGIKIDEEKNNVRGKEKVISADDSKVKLLVVPTNEELMIARDTDRIAK